MRSLRVIGDRPVRQAHRRHGRGDLGTSKIVIVSPSSEPGDVDYLFGQVSIDQPFDNWSNCGNLSACRPVRATAMPPESRTGPAKCASGRRISRVILNQVPITDGEVQDRDFELDGVTFPAAEIPVDFMNPVDPDEALFPTGNLVDQLEVPGVGTLEATMITAGIPTIFVKAEAIGYTGCELQDDINGDADALAKFELIRSHGAVAMGLISDVSEAVGRQHTPKVAFVAEPKGYGRRAERPYQQTTLTSTYGRFPWGNCTTR